MIRLLVPRTEVIVTGLHENGLPWAEYGVVQAIHDDFVEVKLAGGQSVWFDRNKVTPRGDNSVSDLDVTIAGQCSRCGVKVDVEDDHMVLSSELFCSMCMKHSTEETL